MRLFHRAPMSSRRHRTSFPFGTQRLAIPTLASTAAVLCFCTVTVADDPLSKKDTPVENRTTAEQSEDRSGGDPFAQPREDPFASSRASKKPRASESQRTAAPSAEATEPRIVRFLEDPVSFTFIETPLQDAVRQIVETHDLPILIDNAELENIGHSADTPITIDLEGVTGRSFLRLMLREHGLSYTLRDEVLLITSVQAAEENRVLRVYRLEESTADKSQEILAAIQTTIQPEQWTDAGGPCSAAVVDGVLMVSANLSVHEGIAEFLEKFDRAIERRRDRR